MFRARANRHWWSRKNNLRKALLTPLSCAAALALVTGILAPGSSTTEGLRAPSIEHPLRHIALATSDTWAVQSSGSTIFGVSCVSANTCMAVGYGDYEHSLVLTTTNGVNWTQTLVADDYVNFNAVECVTASTCFAVTNREEL